MPQPYLHPPPRASPAPMTVMGWAWVTTVPTAPALPPSAVAMAEDGDDDDWGAETLTPLEVTAEKKPGPGMGGCWAVAPAALAAYCSACPRRAEAK